MKSKLKALSIWLLVLCLTGCVPHQSKSEDRQQKIYFYDETRNDVVSETLGEAFNALKSPQEQVEYIINQLIENKTTQLTTLQNTTPIPYLRANISEDLKEDPTVKFHFTEAYYHLTPAQKIGMRTSIVYSLTALSFVNGVDFYVEDVPLTTATGKTVGVIYPSQIKMDVLDPNPATTPYTLSLYYANDKGKLEKEVRGVLVSDAASVEKLLIEELMNGPSVDGLKATMPKDVKVNEVKVANGVCQVDLSFDAKDKFFSDDRQRELMIYSMVNSLTDLPPIKKVVIFLNGQSGIPFTKDIDFGDIIERSENYISQK